MAKLAKEATTVRRVLEPMFRIFDSGKHWSPQHGIALCILYDMQQLMERSGNAKTPYKTIHVWTNYSSWAADCQ